MEGLGLIVGLLLLADGIFGRLSGEHLCPEERRSTVNVTEYFIRNSTIRHYQWCLNVPPRCSFYTTKLLNDSRVVEKEVIDIIDRCCPGYIEYKNTICVAECPECINGTCLQGKCNCFPGYKGDLCHTECDAGEWGKNCKFKCFCDNGDCDSKTGNCICPPGWTGNRCHSPCPEGFFGHRCQQRCNCQTCNHVTGDCVTTTTILTTDKTTPLTTEKTTPTTTIEPITTTETTPKTAIFEVVSFKNNGQFESDINGFIQTTTIPVTLETINERQIKTSSSTTPPTTIVTKSTRTKQITMTTDRFQEENYLKGDFDRPPANKNDLVSGASAATAISVAVIVVAVVIVATNHFIRSRKRIEEQKERNKGMPTVSVYAHSIFHTPLPEPPTFENPIFAAPLETTGNGEGQRFETRVVCSMNFPSHPSKDSQDYVYDHPPSTGSYRAASIPEPPELGSVTHVEPLYDEIPSGLIPTPVSVQPPPSYKSASLYMNTCGKTRL